MPPSSTRNTHELQILEQLEANPDLTQADLAEHLGVAVGTINFAIQRLIKKGYLHAKQLQRRRLQYILTPAGIALRTKLAMDSLNYGMRLYRETRAQARTLIEQARQAGHTQLAVEGEGDLADVVRLTCLEMGIPVTGPQAATATIDARMTPLTLLAKQDKDPTS